MKSLILIAHNLRSSHNIGSLLRTADGLGLDTVYLTGYTPYPQMASDSRLPHVARKVDAQITKTALGAEKMINWQHGADIETVVDDLKRQGYTIAALEQAENSTALSDFSVPARLALVVGREVEGLEPEVINLCDHTLEIPMLGKKESFNVVQAAAMALYYCRLQM